MSVEIFLETPFDRRGEGRIFEAVCHFIEEGRAEKFRWLVPTQTKVHGLEKQFLERFPNGFFELPISTIDQWAMALWERAKQDVRLLKGAEQRALIDSLLWENRSRWTSLRHASRLSGLAEKIIQAIRDRKQAGIFAKKYLATESRTPRENDFSLLFDAYQVRLRKDNLADKEEIFHRLCKDLSDPASPLAQEMKKSEALYLSGFYDLTPLQFDFVRHVFRCAKTARAALPSLPGADQKTVALPQKFFDGFRHSFSKIQILKNKARDRSPSAEIARRLFAFPKPKGQDVRGKICVSYFRDKAEELEAMAREIAYLHRVEGKPWETCRVLFPSPESYRPYAETFFSRFGVPFHFTGGLPLHQHPFTRCLLSILSLVPRLQREKLLSLLRSNYFDQSRFLPDTALVESLSEKAYLVEGSASDWLNAISDAKRLSPEALFKWKTFFDALSPLSDKISPLDFERKVEAVFRAFGLNPHEHEAKNISLQADAQKALYAFRQTVFALRRAMELHSPPNERPWEDFLDRLRSEIMTVKLPDTTRGHGIAVSGMYDFRAMDTPYLFVGGLAEGDWPPQPLKDYFAGSQENFSPIDRRAEARWLTAAYLGAASERLYLFSPVPETGAERLPSPYLQEVLSHTDPDSLFKLDGRSYEGLDFPSMAVQAGKSLSRYFRENIPSPVFDFGAKKENWSFVPFGQYLRAWRETSEAFSPYDGVLKTKDILETLQDFVFGETSYHSPTALDDYAVCSFKYFAKRILRLAPREALQDEAGPLERGSAAHKILFLFFSRHGDMLQGEPSREAERAMRQTAEAVFAEQPFKDSFWASERRKYLSGLDAPDEPPGLLKQFLDYEVSDAEKFKQPLRPAYFELAFGPFKHRQGESLPSMEKGLVLTVRGKRFKLRGRIDRVDLSDEGNVLVYDYKTGTSLPTLKKIGQGLSLQLPVYLLALEKNGIGAALGAAYYVLNHEIKRCQWFSEKGVRKGVGMKNFREVLEQSENTIQSIAEGMAHGRFHTPLFDREEDFCKSCDFSHMCQKHLSRNDVLRSHASEAGSYVPHLDEEAS